MDFSVAMFSGVYLGFFLVAFLGTLQKHHLGGGTANDFKKYAAQMDSNGASSPNWLEQRSCLKPPRYEYHKFWNTSASKKTQPRS